MFALNLTSNPLPLEIKYMNNLVGFSFLPFQILSKTLCKCKTKKVTIINNIIIIFLFKNNISLSLGYKYNKKIFQPIQLYKKYFLIALFFK